MKEKQTKKEHRIEVMFKAVILFGAFCAVLCVVLLVLAAATSHTEKFTYFLRYPAIGFLGAGLLLIVMPFVVKIEGAEPAATLERLRIEPALFQGLSDNLGSRITAEGYSDAGEVFRSDEYSFRLYEKTEFDLYRFIAIINASQLNDSILESANDCFIDLLQNRRLAHERVSLLVIFAVEQENNLLREAIQSNTDQELNSYKYSAGVVLSTKQAILTNKKDGLAIKQYRKLRKLFLRIIGP